MLTHLQGGVMTTIQARPRVVVVGGRGDGVPPQMRARFEVVKHISREMGGTKDGLRLSRVDYVFVIRHFATHAQIERVRRRSTARVVLLPKGWPRMQERLQALGILPPDPDVTPDPFRLLEGDCGRRLCAWPRCGRSWTAEKPFLFGIFCSKVCLTAARRRGISRRG